MGESIRLTASDGFVLGAYRTDPAGPARGGVVVLQEIFGVNSHIRSICDRLAAEGYSAVAPALFDRFAPDFQSGYSPDEVAAARQHIGKLDWDAVMQDTAAAADLLRGEGPVATIGFCLGGSVSYLAAVRLPGLAAAIGYYGGQIVRFADEAPRCPVQLHFGEQDHAIPVADVETIRAKRPECEVHLYPAGHGFNCDERASFDAPSAKLAWGRSLAFLEQHVRR
ncbi:MAG TPA: dienelactone hydrolase family protein [Microvirga sp.]|nr:dienelactone hydrolase family protein [Microvirga sp.]